MKLIKSRYVRVIWMFVLITGLGLNACKDSSTSVFEDEEIVQAEKKSAVKGKILAQAGQIIIDSFDQGPHSVTGNGNGVTNVFTGLGPIGDMRELYGQEGHPVTSTHIISGTAPGENRITWSNGLGATIQELRYGSCIDPTKTRSDREAAFMHGLAECSNPNSSELNADFSSIAEIEIDFINLLGGAVPNYWRVVVIIHSGTGISFRYDNSQVPYQQGPFTLSIPLSDFSSAPAPADLADVDGIAISMGNNGNFSTSKDIAISEIRAVGEPTEPVANVYISDSSVNTYDPIFPAIADPNWGNVVCTQSNSFGINANWSNPHKAFQVTRDPSPNGAPHPWESNTFDAFWINTVNDMDSPDTKDINGNSGPGGTPGQDQNPGHNWTRYETDVSGTGEFVIQLLADNCSWVYLADESGNNPQLIGFQAVTSSPGEYGVNLDGDHQLIFIIYDGGGLAGGKFRLETTESFGGTPPPPIEPEEPEVITYTSQQGIKTWDPIVVNRNPDFRITQCADAGPDVITLDDPRWNRTSEQTAYSVRGLLPSNYLNEFTFERAWNGKYGLANFDAEWINAVNSPWSRDTHPASYSTLPDGKGNWTRYELPVDGNGAFELKLLADDCSWIYLDNQLIGYQDDTDLGVSSLTYGVTLNGPATLSFIVFDQGGEAGGKFILQTTTEDIPPYEPPTPVNNAPVANAGTDQTVTATGATTSVTLDGTGSSDADGDALTYSWVLNGSEVSTSATPSINLADGSYTFTLTVSDGEASDADDVSVTVVNTVPVANAGADQTLNATGQTTPVTLSGSGTDADGDALTYSWVLNGSEVSTSATPSINLADGSYTLTLTVSDGVASDSDGVNVTVVNTVPVANAGPDQTLEATGPTTLVTLSGSATDADGDALSYSWSNGSSGTSTTLNLGVGTHTFTFTATDGQGASDTDEVTVKIEDTTSPVIAFNQQVSSLWPPNHKMVLVATGISASDIVDGFVSVSVRVSSNESSNGKGDGNTDSDYEIVTNFDGSVDVYVRSERSGKGGGRTYTISMTTQDLAGNGSLNSFEVSVAKSQGRTK